MSISPMDLATYYGVDDIPAALSIGDSLHSLLVAIFRNEPLTSPRYDILASYDLNALRGFINGDMTLPEFRRQSAVEQEQRCSKSLYYKIRAERLCIATNLQSRSPWLLSQTTKLI